MARLRRSVPEHGDDSDDSDWGLPDLKGPLIPRGLQLQAQEVRKTLRRQVSKTMPTNDKKDSALHGLEKTFGALDLGKAPALAIPKLAPTSVAGQTPARSPRRLLKPIAANAVQSERQRDLASKEAKPKQEVSRASEEESNEEPVRPARSNRLAGRPARIILDSDTEEESILCGSDDSSYEEEEEEEEVVKKQEKPPATQRPAPKTPRKTKSRSITPSAPVIDLTTPPTAFRVPPKLLSASPPAPLPPLAKPADLPQSTSRPTSSSSSGDVDAILRFSPPPRSPRKAAPIPRACTPPPTEPPKSRLVSPTKAKATRIPTPPHLRQSLDAFWDADTVNTWNDTHSPRKVLTSPSKSRFGGFASSDSDDSDFPSPSNSPKKTTRSPSKPSADPTERELRAAKKAFDAQKAALAESFLKELDDKVTSSQLAALTATTGGITIIWSNKLNTTAGRANWRRETIRTKDPTTTTPTNPHGIRTAHRHRASIELASKVIDDASRLRAVLAHEFCHLANFILSNVRDQPHGPSFRAWAARVERAFPDIRVTTKHTYAIAYRYVWRCENPGCDAEYRRHSRSVDPTRHACGKCRGRLVQVKPVPRGGGGGNGVGTGKGEQGKRGLSEYQVFVKENHRRVREELVKVALGEGRKVAAKEVMEELGRRYREEKARRGVREVVAAVEEEEEGGEEEGALEKGLKRLVL